MVKGLTHGNKAIDKLGSPSLALKVFRMTVHSPANGYEWRIWLNNMKNRDKLTCIPEIHTHCWIWNYLFLAHSWDKRLVTPCNTPSLYTVHLLFFGNNFDAVETFGDLHVELYDFRQDKILAQARGVVGVRGWSGGQRGLWGFLSQWFVLRGLKTPTSNLSPRPRISIFTFPWWGSTVSLVDARPTGRTCQSWRKLHRWTNGAVEKRKDDNRVGIDHQQLVPPPQKKWW